jgi:hypothetical protein
MGDRYSGCRWRLAISSPRRTVKASEIALLVVDVTRPLHSKWLRAFERRIEEFFRGDEEVVRIDVEDGAGKSGLLSGLQAF